MVTKNFKKRTGQLALKIRKISAFWVADFPSIFYIRAANSNLPAFTYIFNLIITVENRDPPPPPTS